jgi:hypothetical protein
VNDQIAYPDGDQANYAYDSAGNAITVSNSASVPYAAFSGYNALGQVGTIAYHNGVTTTMTYNAATNRLNELSSTALCAAQFHRSDADWGRIGASISCVLGIS